MKRLKSENAPSAIGPYSVATEFNGIIYTSGQLPINPKSGKIDEDSISWQTQQAMNNLKMVLEENGSSLDDIMKTTILLADILDFQAFNEVYAAFFKEKNYPSRTAFEVANLPMNALIEIEAIAKVKGEKLNGNV